MLLRVAEVITFVTRVLGQGQPQLQFVFWMIFFFIPHWKSLSNWFSRERKDTGLWFWPWTFRQPNSIKKTNKSNPTMTTFCVYIDNYKISKSLQYSLSTWKRNGIKFKLLTSCSCFLKIWVFCLYFCIWVFIIHTILFIFLFSCLKCIKALKTAATLGFSLTHVLNIDVASMALDPNINHRFHV